MNQLHILREVRIDNSLEEKAFWFMVYLAKRPRKIRHVMEFSQFGILGWNKSEDRTKEPGNFTASKALHLLQSFFYFFIKI